ncbi:VanW family protein [Granulicoccus phenolivorans]|uniref:VanW family protein n=1 Tax=Granulicoccus phenolivorans TaxID=266854 RepID=UPI000422D020|nr:VanW family protein [Granulicoccus phenolivorans]
MSIALTPEPSLTFVPPPAGFVPPERVTAARRLTERIPALYPLAVRAHQLRQHLRWRTDDRVYARTHATDPLEHRVKQHNSLLLRELSADEMRLQHNKVINLRLASAETDGILIRPGESFSFNRTVGNCTRARGFVEGMRLTNGRAIAGVGGGICQLANLIHWMVLHSPLTVTARSEHSFDPFPDKGRVLPWGVGCSIVWNYVDLVVSNDTDATFRLATGVGERYLEGALTADRALPHSYKVYARDEQFIRHRGELFRRNEIWRRVIDRRTGNTVGEELMKQNCALVTYEPRGVEVIDCDA